MESFESLIASRVPVLVDFYAEWCGPCRVMKPILEELKRIKGDKIRIAKVDVDKHEELATTHRIQSVPTLMVYKQGKMLWRQSGVIQLAELQKIVEQYE